MDSPAKPINIAKSILEHLDPNTLDYIFQNPKELSVNGKPLICQIPGVTHNLPYFMIKNDDNFRLQFEKDIFINKHLSSSIDNENDNLWSVEDVSHPVELAEQTLSKTCNITKKADNSCSELARGSNIDDIKYVSEDDEIDMFLQETAEFDDDIEAIIMLGEYHKFSQDLYTINQEDAEVYYYVPSRCNGSSMVDVTQTPNRRKSVWRRLKHWTVKRFRTLVSRSS